MTMKEVNFYYHYTVDSNINPSYSGGYYKTYKCSRCGKTTNFSADDTKIFCGLCDIENKRVIDGVCL